MLITLGLGVLTWAVWQYRFAAVSGQFATIPGHDLAGVKQDLRGTASVSADGKTFQLPVGAVEPHVLFAWTAQPAPKYAYVTFEAGCENEVVGSQKWSDARVMLIWTDRSGRRLPPFLPVWSARGTHPLEYQEFVMPLASGDAVPCLNLENLGSAGTMTVTNLKMQPVELRAWAPWAVAGLVLAWTAWIAAGIRIWISRTTPLWRALAGAVICVSFGWYICVPGPWMPWRPFFTPLPLKAVETPVQPKPEMPPETTVPPVAPVPAPATPPATVTTAPALPERPPETLNGSALRGVLADLSFVKPYLHLLAFCGIYLALVFLTKSQHSAWLAGLMGILSELCEWAYGFGFDRGDVMDLILDAASIFIGMLIWRGVVKWLPRLARW